MLADFMHYAALKNIDLDTCLRVAKMHFEDETASAPGQP
jgi:hypothetical protein